MALSDSYCTANDLRDVYPQIDEFDTKEPLFGWSSDGVYVSYDTGTVNSLFVDGKSLASGKKTIATTVTTAINNGAGYNADATTIVVDSGADLLEDTYIKIGDEILLIISISTNSLVVRRGQFSTVASAILDDASVYKHFQSSSAVGVNGDWLYDSANDFVLLKYGSDPSDSLTEAGEDWNDHQTDIIKKASRYFDSRVDATISRDQFKDKNGEYDYLVVRTTALIACTFLISAHTPNSGIVDTMKEEFNFNIDLINTGKAKLSHQISGDSSQGIVREVVSPQNANPLYLVDTRGSYTGSSYDLIKVVISTAGVIGTGKFDVYVKDSDGLKNNQVVTAEKITGDYQSIGNGLYIRFQGKDSSSTATAGGTPDEWEIEVWGKGEELADVGINAVRSVGMTRGGYGVWQ